MWEHKGFKIKLDGATFRTTIGDKRKSTASLAAAKKAIDKHLDESTSSELNFAIVSTTRSSDDSVNIVRNAITGVDVDSLSLNFRDPVNRFSYGYILPDSEENADLLMRYQEAARIEDELKGKLNERSISRYLGRHSRTKVTLSEAVARITANYAEALKASQPTEP